jgi:dihydrodipicolinate synthase
MKKHDFSGVGVAIVTPFDKNEAVDFAALARIVERIIAGGADYIVALGTTSESPTLTADEKRAVAKFIKEKTAGRVPLMIGIGGNCTREVVATLKSGIADGYDAVLSVCPYYNKPNQEGLYCHFKALAEVSPLPIVLYNVQGRTGVNMLPETVARLAKECGNIIGIKEASGNIDQMARIRELAPESFALICGDDGLTVDAMRRGGVGVISVLAQLYPAEVAAVVRAAADGRFDEADALLAPLGEITSELFEEGNPVGIKTALSIKGVCRPVMRLPLVEGSAALAEKMKRSIAEYENRA